MFIFLDEKKVSFTYWLQAITQWNWYFNQKEFDYFQSITGPFSVEEIDFLKKFSVYLQQHETGYLFIWDSYKGQGSDLLGEAEKLFMNKFDLIWKKHSASITVWKQNLESYNWDQVATILQKVGQFYGVNLPSFVEVHLTINFEAFSNGHTKKEAGDTILLSVSLTEDSENNLSKVVNVLVHETVHLIEYRSNSGQLLYDSYVKNIKPLNLKQKNPSWHFLHNESVVTSIAGINNSYLGHILGLFTPSPSQKSIEIERKSNRENINSEIRNVASQLLPKITKYLNEDHQIDQDFCNQVSNIWKQIKLSKI